MKGMKDMLPTKDYHPQRCDTVWFHVYTFLQNNSTLHHSTIFVNDMKTSPLIHLYLNKNHFPNLYHTNEQN